jgi:phenylacetate-CoA ligase
MAQIALLKDLYYTYSGIRLYNKMLRESCYWPRHKIENYQFEKLKILLLECYDGIPYYKQLFDSISFNPRIHFNELSDLRRLPILSKEFAKENKEVFINQKYVKNSINFKTSGSTGVPFEILVHPNQWIMEQGVVWRHWKWAGYNFRDPLAMVRSFVPKNKDVLWKHNRINNFTYYSPFHLNETNIKDYLKSMIEKKIVVLRGYPSSVLALAEYVLKYKCEIPPIKMVLTASEVLTDKDRQIIETTFKAKVSNHYGLAEQIVMMGDCEKHEGLHNYDEYGYLELLDTEDPKVKRIIGTNFNNLTTPLIRYDTGDMAVIADEPCSCGRSLPTIKNIIGRKDAVIRTEEGYEIPTVNFYTMFEDFQELERWQIVQQSLTEIDFKVQGEQLSAERLIALEKEIKRRLSDSMKVNIQVNAEFIKKGEGKTNSFISLLTT